MTFTTRERPLLGAPRLPIPFARAPRFPSLTSPSLDLIQRTEEGIRAALAGMPEVPMVDWYPAVTLVEEPDEFIVTVELPGVRDSDVTIDFTNHALTIKGEKKAPEIRGNGSRHVHRAERAFGSFERIIRLPRDIAESQIAAEFSNGVLRIRLPRTEEAKARRHRIPIVAK